MPTIDFESLQQLFPTDADIPEDARLPAPIHQRVSLVDGELVPWDGACKTVLSPVCVRRRLRRSPNRSRSAAIR